MPPQEIKKYVDMRPFIPFRLYISDGSSMDVPEPMACYIDKLHVEVGVGFDAATGLYEKSIWVAPNQVTRIEPMPELKRGDEQSAV